MTGFHVIAQVALAGEGSVGAVLTCEVRRHLEKKILKYFLILNLFPNSQSLYLAVLVLDVLLQPVVVLKSLQADVTLLPVIPIMNRQDVPLQAVNSSEFPVAR